MVLATALGLAACGGSGSAAEGEQLPDVELTDLRTEQPGDWDTGGRPLVINFWASWCTPCKTEMPAFQRVEDALGDQVAIVGLTDTLDLDGARAAAEDAGVRYPLLVDDESRLQVDLGVAGLPATVFVAADGTVLGRHVGSLTEAELITEIEDRYDIRP